MYLKEVRIKNFRSLKDVSVLLNENTVLIGENNSGKTAFLDALRIVLAVEELKREYCTLYPETEIGDMKILSAIQYFEKNLCLTEGDMDQVMPQTGFADTFKWFYFRYMERLHGLNVLDFDMLILLTYQLFTTKPNIARIYRSVYRYIHIDEFQDTNYGQYMLIRSMCGNKNNNLFLIADDDQVIYGWNGASHKRIGQFKEEYQADLIQLYQNFRCPPEVIRLANKLIAHNSGRTVF